MAATLPDANGLIGKSPCFGAYVDDDDVGEQSNSNLLHLDSELIKMSRGFLISAILAFSIGLVT